MSNPAIVRDVPRLRPRQRDGHKGTYGRVLIVAGSVGMSGAAILAGGAALRGGAGIVQVAVPEPILGIVAGAQPCYLTTPLPADAAGRIGAAALAVLMPSIEEADAVVVGPGAGGGADLTTVVRELIAQVKGPLVLDADALNSLCGNAGLLKERKSPFVLTPHPGEFSRLTGSTTADVQRERQTRAEAFASEHGGVLLLKGAETVITDGSRTYVNTTGNSGMATGGTGDVLSGLLGALLASGELPAFEATIMAAYLHGLAGDLARDERGETSLIATDVLEWLPAAFKRHAGTQ